MRSLRHRLFSAAFELMAATRADTLLRPLAQGAGVILMFHHVRPPVLEGFAPNRILEITPDFLGHVLRTLRSQGFELISLDEVPDRLSRPRAGRPFAVLTFDDGYRDNRDHAMPILREHRAPWTLFVTTEFASGRGQLWWLELEEVIRRLDRVVLDLPGRRWELPARTDDEKSRAFQALYWHLRAGPEERLRTVIAGLVARTDADPGGMAASLCLDWHELSELGGEADLTIGAHTLSHPMLAKHPAEKVRDEIVGSRALIEERLGRTVRHFAYPVGDAGSAGSREFAMAASAGFATAVTTRPGHTFPEHARHLHALPRVSINGLHQTDAALRALLSGVPFVAWNRGRRVSVG